MPSVQTKGRDNLKHRSGTEAPTGNVRAYRCRTIDSATQKPAVVAKMAPTTITPTLCCAQAGMVGAVGGGKAGPVVIDDTKLDISAWLAHLTEGSLSPTWVALFNFIKFGAAAGGGQVQVPYKESLNNKGSHQQES